MTNREFLTAIAANVTLSAELVEFAKANIEKLDAKNAARAAKPSKTAIANAPLKADILEYIKINKGSISPTIAAACGCTTQKAVALLTQLVNEGLATVADVKVPKKGKMKAYTAVEVETVEDEEENAGE